MENICTFLHILEIQINNFLWPLISTHICFWVIYNLRTYVTFGVKFHTLNFQAWVTFVKYFIRLFIHFTNVGEKTTHSSFLCLCTGKHLHGDLYCPYHILFTSGETIPHFKNFITIVSSTILLNLILIFISLCSMLHGKCKEVMCQWIRKYP